MRFTLRQLEVFLAVARTDNVSRAAVQLSMSQSAVSGALSDLERQFDIKLFDRVGKRVQLSELGRTLRARAEALFEHAAEFERALDDSGEVGRLRVGATLTIGNHVAVPLIARFMQENVRARATLEVANTAEIARRVANFELDLGLIEGEVIDSDLDVLPWRDDELVVFCAPGHAFERKRALRDADLKRASWIVRESGSGTRQAFEHAMHGLLPDLNISLELQHTEAIKGAVEAGLGVGCVSRIALEESFRHGNLVPCRVPHRNFQRQFYFLLHRRKYRSGGVQAFIDLCRAGPGR